MWDCKSARLQVGRDAYILLVIDVPFTHCHPWIAALDEVHAPVSLPAGLILDKSITSFNYCKVGKCWKMLET